MITIFWTIFPFKITSFWHSVILRPDTKLCINNCNNNSNDNNRKMGKKWEKYRKRKGGRGVAIKMKTRKHKFIEKRATNLFLCLFNVLHLYL